MNLQELFKQLGKAITSVGFVIFFMLFLIIGMIFLSHTLFVTVLQSTAMSDNEVIFASWFLALGFEFTILITAVNTHHLNKGLPIVFAVCSYFLLSFVLEAWTADETLLALIRHFIALMGATINYTYADLFQKKWRSFNTQIDYKAQFQQLSEQYDLKKGQCDLRQRHIENLKADRSSLESKLDELTKLNRSLSSYKAKMEASTICEHCGEQFESANSVRSHIGRCPANPKNKQ